MMTHKVFVEGLSSDDGSRTKTCKVAFDESIKVYNIALWMSSVNRNTRDAG